MRRWFSLGPVAVLVAWFASATVWAQAQPQSLPMLTLNAGMHNIRAQVASTPMQRELGLMFRREMPAHEGMLFIFEAPSQQCFWMRNTLMPLSIAFLRDDGSIVNVDEMQPQTDDSHCSKQPVRFVLEMNKGWFTKRGLGPGSKISGLPAAR